MAFCFPLQAVEWAYFATVSDTLGINTGRVCVGDASKGDIGCPTYAPTVSSAGLLTATTGSFGGLTVTGSVSATNISASALAATNVSATNISASLVYSSGQITAATIISTTAIQLASDTTACTSGTAGRISYVSGDLYVCNGTSWTSVGSGAGGASIPAGTVSAFNLASCPSGWSEVTDARGRFIVGVGTLGSDSYALGATGGSARHTLTTAELPAHTHTVDPPSTATSSNGTHTHTGGVTFTNGTIGPDWMPVGSANTGSSGAHTHTVDIAQFNSGSAGSGDAHENRPPYLGMLICEYTGGGGGGGGGGGEGGVSMLVSLTDVTISSPASGQVLTYNGSAWVNDDATGGSGDWYGIASIPAQVQAVSNSGNITLGTLTASTASATAVTAQTVRLSQSSAACSDTSDHGKLRRDPSSGRLQICMDR